MADGSTIEWLARPGTKPATWNPVRGCTRVSPGCGGPGHFGGCYAEAMAARFSDPGMWGEGFAERVEKPDGSTVRRWTGRVELVPEKLAEPLRWRDPRTIFVNSTSDLFHEKLTDDDIDQVFAVAALTPQHTHIILTKRSDRMRRYLSDKQTPFRISRIPFKRGDIFDRHSNMGDWPLKLLGGAPFPNSWPLPNVWLGVSAERQQEADERVPDLLATPAAIRFVSAEPLLGPINFRRLRVLDTSICAGFPMADAIAGSFYLDPDCQAPYTRDLIERARLEPQEPGGIGLNWIIVGGESGPNSRPMHVDWARSIRDQCTSAGVPFFFKQWGNYLPAGQHMSDGRLWSPDATLHATKSLTGHLLDGREHLEFPKVSA